MAGADDDSTPPAKPPPAQPPKTQYLQPKYVVGSDEEAEAKLRELDRKAAADARRAQGRLSDASETTIDGFLVRHSDKSSHWIAEQMQGKPATRVTYPKKGKLVPYTIPHLARKIACHRKQK